MPQKILIRSNSMPESHIAPQVKKIQTYLESNSNEYMYTTNTEVKFQGKTARTRKLGNQLHLRDTTISTDLKSKNTKYEPNLTNINTEEGLNEQSVKENNNIEEEYVGIDFGYNTEHFKINSTKNDLNIVREKKNSTTTSTTTTTTTTTASVVSRPVKLRKNSIARITGAFRDFQNKITSKNKLKMKQTLDENDENVFVEYQQKKPKRSNSLPMIQVTHKNNIKRTQSEKKFKRTKSDSLLPAVVCPHCSPMPQRIYNYNKTHQNLLSTSSLKRFQKSSLSNNTIASSKRSSMRSSMTSSVTSSEHTIDEEEIEQEMIARRRKQGRSRSAQLQRTETKKIKRELLRKQRSLSTDCDELGLPFHELMARRLHASKETQLCSTDI